MTSAPVLDAPPRPTRRRVPRLRAFFLAVWRALRRAWTVGASVWRNSHVRLFVASMLAGLLLAVMTGPEGSAAEPTSGFTGSLSAPRVYWFLGVGVVLFALRTTWTLAGDRVSAWVRMAKAKGTLVLTVPARRVVADLVLIGFGFVYVTWLSPHDTWKGGVCIQLGAVLLAIELVTFLLRIWPRRFVRVVAYGFVALYGLLAWMTGPVSRYLNRIGAVPHNEVLGLTLLAVAGTLVVIELVVWALGTARARVGPRRGRGALVGVGLAMIAYGFLTWTSWSQWDATTPKSLAKYLADHHLLVHAPTAGNVLLFVGVLLVAAALGWLIADLVASMGHERRVAVVERFKVGRAAPPSLGKPALIAAALLLALEWPLHMGTASQSNIDLQIMPYVLLGLGLNVVIGYAGLLDLGYVAFYAIGAYTTAFLTGALPVHPGFILSNFWVIPFAIAAAMAAGVLLGTPTLRLRGDYLAIVTLGFGEIVYICAINLTGVTGGAEGVFTIPYFRFHVLTPILNAGQSWSATSYMPTYYLILAAVIASMIAFNFLNQSKVGRSWAALREDEPAADSLGINALKYKVMAFAIGASTAGFAGVFIASQNGTLQPADFTVQFSITVVVVVVFGGMGSLAGPVIGAIVVQGLPAYLQQESYSWYNTLDFYIYLGAILVVMMIFRPQGIIPSRRRRREIQLVESGVGSVDDVADPSTAWRTRVYGSGFFMGERGYLSAEDR